MKIKLFLLLTAALLLAAPRARAQVVLNANDSGSGSLPYVVANAANGATITFDPGLSGQTISLGSSEILLNKNVTIDASALPLGIQITQPPFDPAPAARIFQVASNVTVSLKALTLGGGGSLGGGGAIFNSGGTLTLTSCILRDNIALAGGAIHNSGGTLTLTGCLLHVNQALRGGAISNDGGTLTLNQCTLTGNSSDDYDGGAINNYGGGSLAINHSTITGNSADSGGGVSVSSGSFSLFNSIVAGNTAIYDANISGAYTEKGTNLVGGDPLLLPLGNYGGPTPTMPPLPNSPALNAGADFILIAPFPAPIGTVFLFPTDQRGRPRLFGAHVDIGAVELQSPMVVTNLADDGPGSLRQAVSIVEPAESITFAAGLSGQTIDLTGGPLVLGSGMTIDASALTGGLRLNGNGRVVEVPSGVTATLRALTLQNGYDISQGGGVYNAGALTLDRCTISNNGGSGESITPQGGGVYNAGNLIVDQCTITANRARSGGGIYSPDGAALTIRQSTIAGNESEVGTAGIRNNGALTLFNSIVAGNNGSGLSPNFYEGGTVVRSGSNLTDGDPMLLPLGNYGGPTQTMPPLPGSPAKDQGGTGGPAFATDQRGFPRVIGTAVDIGAVEEIPGGTYSEANIADIWQSDTDRDGTPFGIEYALGTNPAVSDANAPGRLRIQIGPANQLTFGRNLAAVPNTQWVLKRSHDLQPGSFTEIFRFNGPTGVSTTASGVVGTVGPLGFTITDSTPYSRAFYRIQTEFTP